MKPLVEAGRLLRRGSPAPAQKKEASPLLSMTDEERDFASYQAYLRDLSPDALWDVQAHLDTEQYPRRCEAVAREITRRRLFFISPYTTLEARLRALFLSAFLLALFAFILHALPGISDAIKHAASSLSGSPVVQVAPGQTMPLFSWHDGDARACAGVFRVARFLAVMVSFLATAGVLVYALPLAARRRLRREVLVCGILSVLVSWLLLRVSG